MTIAYNEHLSATQPAWLNQKATHGVGHAFADDPRDLEIARRRISGNWSTEDDVMGAIDPDDG